MAKVTKINHVAVVVPDLENSLAFWRDSLGLDLNHIEDVPSQKSAVAFFPVGDSVQDLLVQTVDWMSQGGYRNTRLFVLTRKNAESKLSVAKQLL